MTTEAEGRDRVRCSCLRRLGSLRCRRRGIGCLCEVNNELYIATIPKTGKVVNFNISVADAESAAFPAREAVRSLAGNFRAGRQMARRSIGASVIRILLLM